MDTDILRTFVGVARTGNVTAAARELHLVQSTVTNRVQTLEKLLGLTLFDRRPHGMSLTDEGALALEQAHHLLDAEDRLLHVGSRKQEPSGVVRLCAPESICAYRIPRLIAELGREHPKISIGLEPAGTSTTFDKVRNREVDLGLTLDEAVPDGLTTATIGYERIIVVAANDRVYDHADENFYLLEEGCHYSDRFLSALTAARAGQITRFGSIEAARSCVEAGLGLSVLPEVACAAAIARGQLVELGECPQAPVPVTMVHHPNRWQSPAVEVVRERLLDLYSSTEN